VGAGLAGFICGLELTEPWAWRPNPRRPGAPGGRVLTLREPFTDELYAANTHRHGLAGWFVWMPHWSAMSKLKPQSEKWREWL